jgi:hypothetical protein
VSVSGKGKGCGAGCVAALFPFTLAINCTLPRIINLIMKIRLRFAYVSLVSSSSMTKACMVKVITSNQSNRILSPTISTCSEDYLRAKYRGRIVSADPVGSNPRYRQRELVSFTKTVVIEDRAHHIQNTNKTVEGG